MLWKWWTVVREKIESSTLLHDHGYSSFSTRVSGSLWVLMDSTRHFDLSSSLAASCVARFMICWVCLLYFSGIGLLGAISRWMSDSLIWNEWLTEVSYYDVIHLCSNFEIDFVCFELMRHLHSFSFLSFFPFLFLIKNFVEIYEKVKLMSRTF